ncbi:GLUCAN ENDO-13-BETA-GLUCOSIDASE BG1-RELATED-RELATED [Salix purpurea]|uniref:glucan endo-1,3-beta-D-glucosidase n=2 Tax=Salix purpurea TaxID=77065 RepID=A0A9Q0WN41_SALPP|nr:GLUCAN ENDO-13-BETA-GLUCOSIDASE BG1-RELATED-RELATED [Salix purpurea]
MALLFSRIAMIRVFLILLLTFSDNNGFLRGILSLGINYGQIGNNLPQPENVLDLLISLKLTKARIYDTNPQILSAFANSSVELIVTVENQMLASLIDPQQALQWVSTRIQPYVPATRITGISVGNEVFTDDDTALLAYLVPAVVNIHGALAQLGLDGYIKVSTSNSLAVLSESFPPSAGTFNTEVSGVMSQFLHFLSSTESPFWINAYPYFAYKDKPDDVPLDYVLFKPNSGMDDPFTKLHYDNMLYAQVDAVIFAIARMGFNGVEVRVSETGWPSKGDSDEVGATLENAAAYNKNILRRQMNNEGTPLRPNMRLEVYLFALFNEDLKPGPTSERNYGLFQPDCTMAYNVGLSALSSPSSSTLSNPSSSTLSSPSSTSSASISLASSATKDANTESLAVYWMVVCLLTFQVLIRRAY